ncbi:MAG TPA: TonB family protein [Bryobacteraceae bacterium]|nr:TonB family protein [Bryobacteraceae bacterium]
MRVMVQSDPLQKYFAASLVTHAVLVAMLVFSGFLHLSNVFGTQHASSGSVGVTMVKTIPIPHREAPVNPLANDSQSVVPEAPAPVKLRKQVVEQPKEAIAIPDKTTKKRKPSPQAQSFTTYRPPVAYQPNQVYSNTPQAASSAIYGTRGAGGIDIGPASVLGNRFGAYVDLMRDRISQHWVTADLHAAPTQKCMVAFTIARDGTVSNVRISQPSGNYLLDNSARRAVLDANPLPALPQTFPQNEATVELGFQVHQ